MPGLLAAGRVADAERLVGGPITISETPARIRLADARVKLARGRLSAALAAAVVIESAGDSEMEQWQQWQVRTLAGKALRGLGRASEAKLELRRAIDLLEAERATLPAGALDRAAFFAGKLEPYRELLDTLLAEHRPREAFAIAERMKGQALQEALALGRVDLSPTMSGEERERERGLEERVTALNRALLASPAAADQDMSAELGAARQALEQFRADLFLRHPQVAARRLSDHDPLLAAAEALPIGAAALEFVVLDQRTVGFLLRHDAERAERIDVETFEVPIRQEDLERRVVALTQALERRDPAFASHARTLYDLLLRPAEQRFRAARCLIVIPDGVLWRLPLQALSDREGVPLLERVAVYSAASLGMLAQRQHQPDTQAAVGPTTLLALGDPLIAAPNAERVHATQRGTNLGALPEAAEEVRAIGALYGTAQSNVRVGPEDSEQLVKEEGAKFDVLHVATHGLLDDGAPMFSALVLAAGPESREDGLLEAGEIADLRLHARLAVLSACETARGKIAPGEGVIGLSWAFLAAGVPTLVVSDWKTDSAASGTLMVDFHRRLLAGAPVAEALRQAELALRRDPRYRHPYYWAPFVAIGQAW